MPENARLQAVEIGDIKVTYLPDGGGIVNPTALYPASDEAGWEKYPELLDAEGQVITTIGGFLIETGDRKIIVDTGIGPVTIPFPGFGPFSGGRYLQSLAESGVAREEVTDVIFTHLHLDHCGWTTVEEEGERRLTFPNARHAVTEAEWAFWHGGDNPAGPDPEAVQKPLEECVEHFEPGEEIAPGVRVLDTPGHTPGHVSLLIEDDGERLILTADTIHGPMQLQEPEWSVAFDIDAETARASREGLYDELTREDTIVAANHFADQVFGRIVVDEDGRMQWEPLEEAA